MSQPDFVALPATSVGKVAMLLAALVGLQSGQHVVVGTASPQTLLLTMNPGQTLGNAKAWHLKT